MRFCTEEGILSETFMDLPSSCFFLTELQSKTSGSLSRVCISVLIGANKIGRYAGRVMSPKVAELYYTEIFIIVLNLTF